jgi:hypothetical protein
MVYTSAPALYRAILDAAAVSPADDFAHLLPECRPLDADEPAAPEWIALGAQTLDAWHGVRCEDRAGIVGMHGPIRGAGAGRVAFAFAPAPGVRSSLAVRRVRARLLALAEQVRKHPALYGGGRIEQEKPRAARKPRAWSAGLVRCWLSQIAEKDYSGAMLTAEQIGGRYYMCGGSDSRARAFVAPMPVEGLPERIISACRDDGRWVVMDSLSGLSICNQRASSRAKAEAEADAIERARGAAEKRGATVEALLSDALSRAAADDESAARAEWCRRRNIADPRECDPAAAVGAAPVECDPAEVPAAPIECEAPESAEALQAAPVESAAVEISADVAAAAVALERLTNGYAYCSDRRAAIESGRRGDPAALGYLVPALRRLVESGRGLERSEARRALAELYAARPDLAPVDAAPVEHPAAAPAADPVESAAPVEQPAAVEDVTCSRSVQKTDEPDAAEVARLVELCRDRARAWHQRGGDPMRQALSEQAAELQLRADELGADAAREQRRGTDFAADVARQLRARAGCCAAAAAILDAEAAAIGAAEALADGASARPVQKTAEAAPADGASHPLVQKTESGDDGGFSARVNLAAAYISAGRQTSRAFDSCFEMGDGDAVAVSLKWRADKRPTSKMARNLWRYICRGTVDAALSRMPEGVTVAEWARMLRDAPAAPAWIPPRTVDVLELSAADVRAWSPERYSAERDALEEVNAHSECAALDAMRHGTPEHVAEALAIVAAHHAAGYLAPELYGRRQALAASIEAHRQSEAAPVGVDACTPDVQKTEPAPEMIEPAPGILHATRPRLVQGIAYRLHVLADAVALVCRAGDAVDPAPWCAADVPDVLARLLARHADEIAAARRASPPDVQKTESTGPAPADPVDVQPSPPAVQKTGAGRLQITITRAEGLADECGKPATVDSFGAADALLRQWSETAPASGGYDKCDFSIIWPDGDEYRGRYDLKHHSAEAPSLTRHMIDLCDWYAGRAQPEHMTHARYVEHLASVDDSTRAAYAAAEQCMRDAGAWRDILRPAPVDLRELLQSGRAALADLVGLGVRYTGGHGPYAGEGGSGAITEADQTRFGLRLAVTLEDGRTLHPEASQFTDGSTPAAYRIDWKRHGAPYLAQLSAAVAMREAAKSSAAEMAKQARDAERVRLLAEFPQLERVGEAKGDALTIAARNVRRLLSARWPGVKFSARIERFSMGNSLRISWTDGPAPAEVDEIAGQFEAGSFDGMTDSYTYTRTTWGDLFGAAKYISTTRTLSDDAIAAVIAQEWGGAVNAPTVADYRGTDWQREDDRRRIYQAARQWSAPAAEAKRSARA